MVGTEQTSSRVQLSLKVPLLLTVTIIITMRLPSIGLCLMGSLRNACPITRQQLVNHSRGISQTSANRLHVVNQGGSENSKLAKSLQIDPRKRIRFLPFGAAGQDAFISSMNLASVCDHFSAYLHL